MTALRVVAWNVKFGDAILLEVPEQVRGRVRMRHALIDVGSVLAGPGSDELFEVVIKDIRRRLDGRPIDLYVMTHEHLDHVRGLFGAHHAGMRLPEVQYAWLTASSHEHYYRRHPEARRRRELYVAEYLRLRAAAAERGLLGVAEVRAFFANNDPRNTADCVAFLRGLALKKTSYVHRGFKPVAGRNHPFQEARLSVWAPEEDTTSYYGRMRPVAPVLGPGGRRKTSLRAPPGVSQDALDALLRFAGSGLGDNLLMIDRASNNTSVVLELEWRGWRLLFTGDAELRSWRTMKREGCLRPVHFLKVGHHASHNGTPPEELLKEVLPIPPPDSRPRCALISTCTGTYPGVPDTPTVARISQRVERVHLTTEVAVGSAVEIEFLEDGKQAGR